MNAAGVSFVPDRVLVRFRGGTSAAARAQVRRSAGARVTRAYRLVPGLELLTLAAPPVRAARSVLPAIARDPHVLYALPDVAYRVQSAPDDPLFGEQWGMESIGAPEAWARTTGSPSVVVAVLDTGITLNHPDLQSGHLDQRQSRPARIRGRRARGGTSSPATTTPSDDFGHGTHVSGIIGAVGNNSLGVSGVNWSVSLMPLKICNGEGICNLSDEIAALEYAVEHGAKIANASFGGVYGGYQPEKEAIAAAGNAGLLYVAAAGNEAGSDDVTPFYPASYPLENIISVAATTRSNGLASFSNYGPNSVDLGAPGQEILSTLPTTGPLSSSTGYGYLSGTSMATPHVAGSAALLWSEHPSWTMQQIRARLLSTTRPLASLAGEVSTCGELDLATATDNAVAEEASAVRRKDRNRIGIGQLLGWGHRMRLRVLREGAPGHTGDADGHPARRLDLRRLERSLLGHWLAHGRAHDGGDQSPRPSTPPSAPSTMMGRRAALSAQRPSAVRRRNEPGIHLLQRVAVRRRARPRQDDLQQRQQLCVCLERHRRRLPRRRDQNGLDQRWLDHRPARGARPGRALGELLLLRGPSGCLSADGSTLPFACPRRPPPRSTRNSGCRYRCAAFVYHHGAGGWEPAGTLSPPGLNAEGCRSSRILDLRRP